MKGKYLLLLVACFFMYVHLPIIAQSNVQKIAPSKEKSIRELLEVTRSADLAIQIMSQMIGSFKISFPDVPEEVWVGFMTEVHKSDLIDIIVPVYDEFFTEKEIKELTAFYKSPLGKKVIEKMPAVMQESMSVGQEWGRKIATHIMESLQEKGYAKKS